MFKMTDKLVIVIVCVVVGALGNEVQVQSYDEVESKVELQCIRHCPLQNRTDIGHYDYACDYKCNIEQCGKGCKLWRQALSSSCQKSCNGTADRLTPKELYCVMGCNDALTKYFSELRVRLGIPPAPALLADSLGATSLKLEWKFPEAKMAGLSCHVQWKYEELSATWQYCRNASWNQEDSYFLVQGLQPYTRYRFRIALNLGHHGDPIISSQSVVISTLASGVPASPPVNVRVAPVDGHSISVSWEPGPFPHGPLLSYVLRITDNDAAKSDSVQSEVKDLSPDNTYYIFRNLKSQRNYTTDIRMRNNNGVGPAARAVVSTPSEPPITDNQQPILILGTDYSVFELEYILGEPMHLFHTQVRLQGIAIHIANKLLFVSDENGYVSRIRLEQESTNKTYILTPQQIDFLPLDLSVDWLNDQLYILGEIRYQGRFIIKRCNLDGTGLTVAFAGLSRRPSSIQIDPCNGYLFWTIQDYNRGGLYRLDISDISNGIRHEVRVKRILNETELGAFVVDHTNFRLLVSYQKQNTINAVSLDGKEITNLRPKVQKSKFQRVISLAMANKKFYWTDGDNVFNEEYHQALESYFHNKITHLVTSHYRKIFINLPSAQPWPVPLNPPTNLQAIFGSNIAKTRWQSPHLLGVQGKGAWQNWSYEISITETTSGHTATYKNINTSSFNVLNLKENTEYLLKVAAYTNFGKGPWSSEFRGTTLSRANSPSILWSAAEGLLRSDAAGDSMETVIHKSVMKGFHFTDISWYKDQVYLVTNNSHVYYYNVSSHDQRKLMDMDSVGSIAVDWIGSKLYWSNPKQQLIIRGNLNGTQQEPLPILTLAKELHIDSVKAYLYWSTEYVVECAHLNGVDRMEYHHVELFSGKQVMGLTLDVDQKYVFWIVRGSDGSNLFKAPMAGYFPDRKISKEKVSLLQKSNLQGPLNYFHRRLLWLQDERNAAISDLSGKNIAEISGNSISGLNMVYVVDETLHKMPDDMVQWEDINVIPGVIDKQSVKVVGSSESFNVTWSPIENVNYGVVFYEIQIDSLSRNDSSITTTEPTIKYWREVTPFTSLHVAIRAFTYWGTSPQIRADIFSPPSTPSAPRNLRTFVVYDHNRDVEFEYDFNFVTIRFRWDPPMNPNGVLQGYKVRCWYLDNDIEMDICDQVTKPPNETEYIITELELNEVYFFQVQAFTEIGTGTLSEAISINSSTESPVPTLLISNLDSIFIYDLDTEQNSTLLQNINTPIEINYILKEKKIFWVNQMQELLTYNLETFNKSKILGIRGKPIGLTLDWLERSLFYVETPDHLSGSVIYKIDLNLVEKNILHESLKIYSTPNNITKIEVSPYNRKLYWIESTDIDNTRYQLLQASSTDGTNFKSFLSSARTKRYNHNTDNHDTEEITLEEPSCNCSSYSRNIDKTFTVDHSQLERDPVITFKDLDSQSIISSDVNGCVCHIITNAAVLNHSMALDKLKSDFGMLYWIPFTHNGTVYSFNRKTNKLVPTKLNNIQDITIYGQHMQPYPDRECLSPLPDSNSNLTVTLTKRTAQTLYLTMPDVSLHPDCANISMATVVYRVFYKQYSSLDNSEDNGLAFSTFDKEIEIVGLKPFTKYLVSVNVSNYYTRNENVVVGQASVFQTAAGAPSKPQNVSATVLHPTLAEIRWLPPKELNGEVIRYEIHWQTERSFTKQKGEQPVIDLHYQDKNRTILNSLLHKLAPNQTYTVWIRAKSENNETSSDSDPVLITTYPEPSAFVLQNQTATSLKLSWELTQHIQEFIVEYAPITSANNWTKINTITTEEPSDHEYDGDDTSHEDGDSDEDSDNNRRVVIDVKGLKPKTQYKFRLSLLYERYSELYIWPMDSRFTFETLGDRPSPPRTPIIQYVKPNSYKVWWEASKENGAPIEMYLLQGLKLRTYRNKRSTNRTVAFYYTAPSIEEEERVWEPFYNGTDTFWMINGLSEEFKYAFRVSAKNSYGWSDPSEESQEFDPNEAARIAEKQSPMNSIIIAICVPISICMALVICFAYISCIRKCGKPKKTANDILAIPRGPDVELATLRELPRRGVHSTNILYISATPTSDEITKLPHIRRDQITLTKFLGSGAFGEVFQGKAKGITNESADTKVAVKTLKKGASDQEKAEFLQEAQLMSRFKHEHILQLLGVCLDNDPHFIIMELMQGGDLLTYLRDSRSSSTTTPALCLTELLKMCLDVSKGCRYLEKMHFVHRDLACRNCLVSSVESESRIVKIGDFGLARDIYKNDYYRKEGEGLLPVRWMAPEALVDGVFTCQSDVWAFGVLLWEIMTLGQQPYQARGNLEVLHYIKEGGRLGKPKDCPEELYKLMRFCWHFDPEKRPTFKYCLGVLERLQLENLRNSSTGAHTQYISTVSDRLSWKDDTEDDSTKEKTPFLPTQNSTFTIQEIPKYIEVIKEPEPEPLENDGYEIPTQMLPKSELSKHSNSAIATIISGGASSLIVTEKTDNPNQIVGLVGENQNSQMLLGAKNNTDVNENNGYQNMDKGLTSPS